MKVAKDEKDGDVRRLLRHVAGRAKSTRRQRSKSALGHLQPSQNERSIDDAVAKAAAAAAKLKLSNDELHTTSSPDLDKPKGYGLCDLRSKEKDDVDQCRNRSPATGRRRQRTQQSKEHARRSHDVSQGLDQGAPDTLQPSHRAVASSLETLPNSHASVVQRSEPALMFSARSPDVLGKQSSSPVAGSGIVNAGLLSSFTGGSGETNTVNSSTTTKSAATRADGHSPIMRRVVTRNRAANMLKCWPYPHSTVSSAEPVVTGEQGRSSSLSRDETDEVQRSGGAETSTDGLMPYLSASSQIPFLEFKKIDYSREMSPLSLSVQCGSDVDDFEGAQETVVIPTHPVTSKRVWNMDTCSWDDADEQRGTDSVCVNHTTPDSCQLSSDVASQSASQDSAKIVFTKPDTVTSSTEPVSRYSTLPIASSLRNHSSANYRLREHHSFATIYQSAVQTAGSPSVHVLRTRQSVTGDSCDKRLAVQSFCRSKSCPDITVFSSVFPFYSVQSSDSARGRPKTSRLVKRAVTKGSKCQRKGRQVICQHLAPPLFASWPGRGDVKGSILAYESSV